MKFSDIYLQAVPFPSIWCHTSIVLHKLAFGGIRGSLFTSLMAEAIIHKPLVADVDRHSQVLWAYVDRRV